MFRQHKALKTAVSIIVILQFGFLMPLAPVLALDAREEADKKNFVSQNETKKQTNYTSLMRGIKDLSGGNVASRQQVLSDFSNFIDQEKDHLDRLPVGFYKKGAYISRLKGQLKGIDDTNQTPTQRILEKIKDFFGFGVEELSFNKKSEQEQKEFKMPDNPAEFGFNRDTPKFKKINNITVPANQKIRKSIKAFITIQEAKAVSVLPVLEDLKGDEHEIIINSTIRDLAGDLNNNPVEIFNFVRENINYEPYYGSKKGNLGCLEEKICNDVDTASLTISLMRAAGIPAHYKKSMMVVPVKELQDLLGIEKTVEGRRTVYGIFAWNKVPVFSITNNPTLGENLDGGDFTNETSFALEWVFPEIYYDYDERGGNMDNKDDLSAASTNEELNNLLQDKYKKQWLPLDVIFKNYNYTQKQIVADSANFDTENFWYNYLQYQGNLSPLKKYAQDLLNITGKDINSQTYQSTNSSVTKNYEILPPALPYVLGEGVDGDGGEILPETWSALPDTRKIQVKIQLKKADTKAVVLEHTFFGSEINNKEINLYYEGATQSDQQIIDSYSGIHATPAELVDINAHFLGDNARYDGTEVFGIGDSMILRFEYYVKGVLEHDDEKFSTAGNQEGIYVVLSQVQEDPYLDTNSKILLRGNVGLAREYLRQVQGSGELFEKSLDYNYNVNFARAVVTQNRILNTINNIPTTFDFKGLTIDAGTYINDWSNRGNYKNHRKDFRLLWGLESSYYEGQIFDNIAGLEGISTVTGLQYAYAHPADYTVHTIKSANESVIDSLALSDNTKANMHADVQKGNTIVTPNKFVTAGNWNGIFYVSLDPVWTGTYAIGEQTGENGGWTIDELVLEQLQSDIDNSILESFQLEKNDFKYIYREKLDNTINCKIKIDKFAQILANVDGNGNPIPAGEARWKTSYGWPCIDDNEGQPYKFGDYQHRFIIATDGGKFYSPGKYDYWKGDNEIEFLFKKDYHYSNGLPQSECTYPMEWRGGYCFIAGGQYEKKYIKTYFGTYVYENRILGFAGDKGSVASFGVYNPEQRKVYDISGRMYEKYVSDEKIQNNYVPTLLGYPITDDGSAALSPDGVSGWYQQFTNGTMYEVDGFWSNKVYIVYGLWDSKHDDLDGTSGIGFPQSDVGYSTTYDDKIQKFEEKICFDFDTYIQCEDKTFSGDFTSGLEGIYDSLFLVDSLLTLNKYDLVLSDFNTFVSIVDNATEGDRKNLCRLYMAEGIYSYSDYNSNNATWLCAFWPGSLNYYKSKKTEIQDYIPKIEEKIYNANDKLIKLQESMQIHVSNSTYSPTEWLGYFAVDIASLIYPVGKLGTTAIKSVALSVTKKYAEELISGTVSRSVFAKVVKEGVEKEVTTLSGNLIKDDLEEAVSHAVVNAVKKAGSKEFTKGGNSLVWSLDKNYYRRQITDINNGFNIFTDFGSGSYYETQFINDGKDWIIKQAFKGNIQDQTFYSSNVILDQYFQVLGRNYFNVRNIKLDTIINKEAIAIVESQGKGAFMNSPVGKMANYIVKDAGKEIKQVIVGDIVEDPTVIGGKYFNAEIILK